MKRILFLFAVCFLTAFVAPEAKAQCPIEEDCDPGEDGGGNGGSGPACWTINGYDYWTQTVDGWVHCYVIERCCERWNAETRQYYIQCSTFTSCGSV